MKQLVVLSGKGGTGKTSVVAAFAYLASKGSPSVRTVLVDADVDAANLDLVLRPQRLEINEFTGGAVAVIDPQICSHCGNCVQTCRFEAITEGENYSVDPVACEGCAACVFQCPEKAISMQSQVAGQWYRSKSLLGPLFHATLYPAQENSGKLVTLVKQNARLCALDDGYELVLVDGPPGIGCAVISSASGADMAVLVTEPTVAGMHDLERVLETMEHFKIPCLAVINKEDIFPEGSEQIKDALREKGVEVIGSIPFDPAIGKAMKQGKTVIECAPESPASIALHKIWIGVYTRLFRNGGGGDR